MDNIDLKRLEFDKIIGMLSDEAHIPESKEACKRISPSSDINEVKKLILQTTQLYNLSLQFGDIPLGGVKSISKTLKKSKTGQTLCCKELLDILSVLACIRKIKSWRNDNKKGSISLDDIFDSIVANSYLENTISKCIISEDEVSDNASAKLSNIRQKIRYFNNKIQEKLDGILNSSSRKYLTDSIITTRSGRFVLPVKSECRNEIKGLVHDVSSSGSTLFVEPMGVVEDNNRINELKKEESREIERILAELSCNVLENYENLYKSYLNLIRLDVISSKVSLAFKMEANPCEIRDDGVVQLKCARHPLISPKSVVPIDIEIGKDFDTLVITGVNTGGKTASLKTLGLLCAMAMSGLMIPAKESSKISIFRNILTDIGDGQSIENSISTFSSHMKNVKLILDEADSQSLVLIDEIGSGTDPEEGAALAVSIIEALRQKGSKTVVTTHYKELKEYCISHDGVKSASCEFDTDTMKPTYKLFMGGLGSSNAFIISEKLGIDESIIQNAQKLLGTQKVKLNSFFNYIEKLKRELDLEKIDVQRLWSQAKETKFKLEKEKDAFLKEQKNIIEMSKSKAQEILDKVTLESENILKTLNNFKAKGENLSADERGAIKGRIRNLQNYLFDESGDKNQKTENHLPVVKNFGVGDRVFLTNLQQEATICQDCEGEEILVNIGKLKIRVNKKYIKLIETQKRNRDCNFASFNRLSSKSVHSFQEIDLRGKASDEAIHELGFFIDDLLISGIHQATIIHGKGTGKLRLEIHRYLKAHKNVQSFRLGNFGEGETGVTIVSLK